MLKKVKVRFARLKKLSKSPENANMRHKLASSQKRSVRALTSISQKTGLPVSNFQGGYSQVAEIFLTRNLLQMGKPVTLHNRIVLKEHFNSYSGTLH